MQEFNVYPKEGEKFSVEFQRFEMKENGFVLYDDRNEPSKEGYLSFENVAAIIPDNQPEEQMVCFLVYLKGQPKPAEVFACHFETEPGISFKWQPDAEDIAGIYIARSEVVAIMPSDGLVTGRHFLT
jgi:hypothetical protein